MLWRYHRAVLDDAHEDAPAFDPPNADTVYVNYLETCRQSADTPVSRERAFGLIQE